MFIQTKCNELSFADLIRATKDTIDESKKFPYKTFVARCWNCQFCYKGKCSLKECCCMGERVKAGSCSFTELLNHCFWIKLYSEVKIDDDTVITAEQIKALQKRNAQLEEENLILKKAIAIFTPHSDKE